MARLNYCELFFILMCCFDALFVHFISCLDGCYSILWTLYNSLVYRLSSTFVVQRKAKVNGKKLLPKPFKALKLDFILSLLIC